jgi:DNA-directed RNA polymerase specialized sigma24 family protein
MQVEIDETSMRVLRERRKAEQSKRSKLAAKQQVLVEYAKEREAKKEVKEYWSKQEAGALERLVVRFQESKTHLGWREVTRGNKEVSIEIADYSESLFNQIRSKFEAGISYECSRWYVISYAPEDLVQECMLALSWAAKSWDGTRNANFNTYAWRCVKNCLQDVRNGGSVNREMKVDQAVWDTDWIDLIAFDTANDQAKVDFDYDVERLPITERQRVVLQGLRQGLLKQEIAASLKLSPMAISWEVIALRKSKEVQNLFGIQEVEK